jgi:hypothetical protein
LLLIVRTNHLSYRAGDEVKAIFRSPPARTIQCRWALSKLSLGSQNP